MESESTHLMIPYEHDERKLPLTSCAEVRFSDLSSVQMALKLRLPEMNEEELATLLSVAAGGDTAGIVRLT